MQDDGPILIPVRERPPNKLAFVLVSVVALVFNVALIALVAVFVGALRSGMGQGGLGVEELSPRHAVALLLLLVYLDLGIISSVRRRYRFRKGMGPISFWSDRFEVPDLSGHVRHELPYSDVLLVQLGRRFVFIDGRRRLVRIPREIFQNAADLEYFLSLVHTGIARLPDGSERLSAMARRLALAETAYRRPMISAMRLIILFSAIYLIQRLIQAPFNQGDIALGANVASLTRDGQLYRLVSANFLHANFVHLGVNGFALLSLGSVLERLLGRDRFIILFLGACVFGSMASTLLAGHAIGLGSSTGVAGLLGGLLYLALRYRERLPTEFRQPWSMWFTLFALNAWLALLVPNIDHVAHLGGFLAGIALTAGLCPYDDPLDLLERPASLILGVSARALVAVITAVFAIGVSARFDEVPDDTRRTWSKWAETATAEELNFMAWTQAAEREIVPMAQWVPIRTLDEDSVLALGEDLARRAVELQPDNHHLRDTYATIIYRRGRLAEAVRLARLFDVAGLEDFGASQLARFELDHLRVVGTPISTSTTAAPSVALEHGALVVRFGAPPTTTAEVHVVVHRDDVPLGLFELRIGPTADLELRIECPAKPCAEEGTPILASLTLFETGRLSIAAGRVEPRFTAYTSEVAVLPRYQPR